MGFDTQDILRQGEFTEGDVLPLAILTPENGTFISTTSTSFTTERSFLDLPVVFDQLAPSPSRLRFSLTVTAVPGSGETQDVRIFNLDDAEEVVRVESLTAPVRVSSGYTDYTPTTTSSPARLRYQHRTNPGSNSSRVDHFSLAVGYQL